MLRILRDLSALKLPDIFIGEQTIQNGFYLFNAFYVVMMVNSMSSY